MNEVNPRRARLLLDTKIFNKVNSVEKVENLRTDLRSLVSWSKEWQMLFNLDKCKIMHVGDRLREGTPSRYVTSQLGQLSLASLRGR